MIYTMKVQHYNECIYYEVSSDGSLPAIYICLDGEYKPPEGTLFSQPMVDIISDYHCYSYDEIIYTIEDN